MPRFVKIVLFLAYTLLVRLISGGGCTKGEVHASGNATYIRDENCTVLTPITPKEFNELLDWCSKKQEGDSR